MKTRVMLVIHQASQRSRSKGASRHHPFMGRASRQRPVCRTVHVKTVQQVPRPMTDEQVTTLIVSLRLKRDKAMLLLMLHGGLRPGEVRNLRLGDISYARRRVTIRYRTDHPKGVRTKSRTERAVDLHQPEALQAMSDYVVAERLRCWARAAHAPPGASTKLAGEESGPCSRRRRGTNLRLLSSLVQWSNLYAEERSS